MGKLWFEQLTGFPESDYASTRRQLAVEGEFLISRVNGSRRAIGTFETPSVAELRQRAANSLRSGRRTRVSSLVGDAWKLHSEADLAGATFQVASQFNALEMVSPDVTPEQGVTRYVFDRTQGPACVVAAGAATIWRNYFLPLDGQEGQTAERQLNLLAGMGALLAHWLGRPVDELWAMRNGYALATPAGLEAIGGLWQGATEEQRQQLRGALAVGWQRGAEVIAPIAPAGQRVTQVFCSALPVAYSEHPPAAWEPFARLVLEATYEATLLAASIQAAAGGSNLVLLTRVGGGAFGNEDPWIDDALRQALALAEFADLDVRLVSWGEVHPSFAQLVDDWTG